MNVSAVNSVNFRNRIKPSYVKLPIKTKSIKIPRPVNNTPIQITKRPTIKDKIINTVNKAADKILGIEKFF